MQKKSDSTGPPAPFLPRLAKTRVLLAIHGFTVGICGVAGLLLLGCLAMLRTLIVSTDLKNLPSVHQWIHVEGYALAVLIVTAVVFEFILIFGVFSEYYRYRGTYHALLSAVFVGWCLSNAFVVFVITRVESRTLELKMISAVASALGLACLSTNLTGYCWRLTRQQPASIPTEVEAGKGLDDDRPAVINIEDNIENNRPVSLSQETVLEKYTDQQSRNLTRNMERFFDIVDEINGRKITRKHFRGLSDETSSMWSLHSAVMSAIVIPRSHSHNCLFESC